MRFNLIFWGNVLDVGSGIGTYSKKLYSSVKGNLFLTDIDYKNLKKLENLFKNKKKVTIKKLDITSKKDIQSIKNKFDTIICLNVLEHIEDDLIALKNMSSLLSDTGQIILLVPAHNFLYNSLDIAMSHKRRYSKKSLKYLIHSTNLSIKCLFFYNFFSIFAWFINGNILKKRIVNKTAYSLFNKLVPLLRLFEKYKSIRLTGISLIGICKKNI
ncbi:MAG: class I SAM-dependent methyltransferase [DPANN group archaeon]|nr:class I SAM-dependent methyltransferase [DPANN group archaeon]